MKVRDPNEQAEQATSMAMEMLWLSSETYFRSEYFDSLRDAPRQMRTRCDASGSRAMATMAAQGSAGKRQCSLRSCSRIRCSAPNVADPHLISM
jgi:hypothetical protein